MLLSWIYKCSLCIALAQTAKAVAIETATSIDAGVPIDHYGSRACIPNVLDAPFGLSTLQYASVYEAIQLRHLHLQASGCSPEVLSKVSDCALTQLADLGALLDLASPACARELAKSLNDIYHVLSDFGCLEESEHFDRESEVEKGFEAITVMSQVPAITTCYAIIKTARLAFDNALHGTNAPSATTIGQAENHHEPVVATGDRVESERLEGKTSTGPSLWAALIAGALAGLAVDLTLFPLDTIKTRLQSSAGFKAAGGLKGLYQGIGSIALGSAPSSALFFLAYEFAGKRLTQNIGETLAGHLLATTIGELASSIVRVPADVVKSRQQVELHDGVAETTTLWMAIRRVHEEGQRPGRRFRLAPFYAGWLSTIVREIPFGCIQFPLFSHLKQIASGPSNEPLSVSLTVLCGIIAGSAAGSLTTPLDVIKTRIMLAENGEDSIGRVFLGILKAEGPGGLFRGVVPRTLWISAGGAIFLGGYDIFARIVDSFL